MNRTVVGIVLVASVAFVVPSCSKDDSSPESTTAPAASATPSSSSPDAGACDAVPPVEGAFRLHADGTLLRDASGRQIVLRGVNAGGRSKFAPYAPFDFAPGGYQAALDAYLDRAQAWGLDVLRVPFSWAAVEPSKGAVDEEFLTRYDALLDAAWARGIWTIVDFHQDIYAEALCGDGFPDWTLPDPHPAAHHDCPKWFLKYFGDADVKKAFDRFWTDEGGTRTALKGMWDRMVQRHKDRPGVIGFEIINEPYGGSIAKEKWEAEILSPFYAELAAQMRAQAPDSLLFLDAAGDDALERTTTIVPPKVDGLVFAPHWYDSGTFVGKPTPDKVKEGIGKWQESSVAWDIPLLLGESGCPVAQPYTGELTGAIFGAVESLGMNFTYWEYSNSKERWNSENFSVVDTDGNEIPEILKNLVRPYPRALAGSAPSFAFDVTTGVFTLTYTPAGAEVTEVVVPERLYPGGYQVEVEGACTAVKAKGVLLVKADSGASVVKLTLRPK